MTKNKNVLNFYAYDL